MSTGDSSLCFRVLVISTMLSGKIPIKNLGCIWMNVFLSLMILLTPKLVHYNFANFQFHYHTDLLDYNFLVFCCWTQVIIPQMYCFALSLINSISFPAQIIRSMFQVRVWINISFVSIKYVNQHASQLVSLMDAFRARIHQ